MDTEFNDEQFLSSFLDLNLGAVSMSDEEFIDLLGTVEEIEDTGLLTVNFLEIKKLL